MLSLDANTTLKQSYVLFITLFNITYKSWGLVSPFYPFQGGVIYPIVFYFYYLFIYFLPPAVALSRFFVWCLYFKKTYKPDQFLVQIKVSFFSNLWFCSSFKSLLLPLKLLFLFVLIFFFFLHVLFCSYFSFSLFCNANISLILLVQSSSLSIF